MTTGRINQVTVAHRSAHRSATDTAEENPADDQTDGRETRRLTTFAGTSQRPSKPTGVCHSSPSCIDSPRCDRDANVTARGPVVPTTPRRPRLGGHAAPSHRRPSSTRVRRPRCGVRIYKTIELVKQLVRLATCQFRARDAAQGRPDGAEQLRATRLACRTTGERVRPPVSAVPRLPNVTGGESESSDSTTAAVLLPSLASLHFSTTYIDLALLKRCAFTKFQTRPFGRPLTQTRPFGRPLTRTDRPLTQKFTLLKLHSFSANKPITST
jgi:hypothetical protein